MIGKHVCWLEIDQGEPIIHWGTLLSITDGMADVEVPSWFGHKHVSIHVDRLFKERYDITTALQHLRGNI